MTETVEIPTPELRWEARSRKSGRVHLILQQRVRLVSATLPAEETEEWRDIPVVNEGAR